MVIRNMSVFATFVHVALASEEDFALDADGISLLQTRVHKLDVYQEPEYFRGPKGTLCQPEEVLTLAQCFEVQAKRLVPHAIAEWSVMGSKRSATVHKIPSGCSLAGTSLEWSDEPVGFAHPQYTPVCSRNGGRAAEIASQGMSCQEPTCEQPPGDHQLNWNEDGTPLPELQILGAGAVCEEACGLLTYAQCAKAADTGVLEEIDGRDHMKRWPQFQCNGGGHSRPAVPSGCWIGANFGVAPLPSFCPYDTPDGALAEWVSDSGVGVGWGLARPVCGVCTTTTTPPPRVDQPEDDEGAAVGDPHMTTNTDSHFELS